MAQKIANYKCPACTGPLHFDADTGRLKCDYCESEYDPGYIEALMAQGGGDSQDAAQGETVSGENVNTEASSKIVSDWDGGNLSADWGSDKVKVMSCPSCGAELILDETTAATSCPYCGNNAIVSGELSGVYKPDYIIPFKYGRDKAEAKLKEYYRGKFFLPRDFASESHIHEVKGIYVPFWLFDGTAHATITAEGRNERVYEQFNATVTEVSHYNITRSGDIDFNKVPVDASSRMPDDYMDSLEPFNYDDLRDFSASYLPGYIADKYDVEFKDCEDRVNKRCANAAVNSLLNTIGGYQSVSLLGSEVNIHKGKVSYGLLPVWLLNSSWNNQNYKFAVNGQTGKVVGKLPVDPPKVGISIIGLTLVIAVLFNLLMFYMGGGHTLDYFMATLSDNLMLSLMAGLIISLIFVVLGINGMKNVTLGKSAAIYVPQGGLGLTDQSDVFTHTTRSVVRHETSQGMRSGGGMSGSFAGRPGPMGGRPGPGGRMRRH